MRTAPGRPSGRTCSPTSSPRCRRRWWTWGNCGGWLASACRTAVLASDPSSGREQSIFNCMISNLFEEYKFFPKHPDMQLKLAVVLFGASGTVLSLVCTIHGHEKVL